MKDKWREAMITYMISVALCDGGRYGLNHITGCIEPLTQKETEILLKEVEERANKEWEK